MKLANLSHPDQYLFCHIWVHFLLVYPHPFTTPFRFFGLLLKTHLMIGTAECYVLMNPNSKATDYLIWGLTNILNSIGKNGDKTFKCVKKWKLLTYRYDKQMPVEGITKSKLRSVPAKLRCSGNSLQRCVLAYDVVLVTGMLLWACSFPAISCWERYMFKSSWLQWES